MSFGRNLPQFTTRGITWISWRNLAVKVYHPNIMLKKVIMETIWDGVLSGLPTMPRCKGGLCDLDVQLTPFQLVSYRTGLLQALAIRKSRMPSTGETKNNLQVRMQMVEGNPMVCESSAQLRTHPKEGGGTRTSNCQCSDWSWVNENCASNKSNSMCWVITLSFILKDLHGSLPQSADIHRG